MKKNMNKQSLFSVNSIMARLGYYFDGKLSRFSIEKNDAVQFTDVVDKPKVLPLLIVNRAFYHEEVKKYPVDNRKELGRLLDLEYGENPFVRYHIISAKDGNSLVNVWTFNHNIPGAYVWLPESLLIVSLVDNNEILTLKTNKPVYFTRWNQGVYSLMQNSIVNSPERFAMSIGRASYDNVVNITFNELAGHLIKGINRRLFKVIPSLIRVKSPDLIKPFITKFAIPGMCVLCLYMAGVSGYLYFKKSYLENTLQARSGDVAAALSGQQDYDNDLAYYKQLREFSKQRAHTAAFWLVMEQMFTEATFTNVRISGERFVLRGSADKATSVLEALTKISGVRNAGFDSPTRSNRGKELFVIGFTIDNQLVEWRDESGGDA